MRIERRKKKKENKTRTRIHEEAGKRVQGKEEAERRTRRRRVHEEDVSLLACVGQVLKGRAGRNCRHRGQKGAGREVEARRGT